MLEPLSPSHIPEKPTEINDEHPLKPGEEIGDSNGYSFNFFKKSKKSKQSKKNDESSDSSVYNQDNAVTLELSDEAKAKLQRQRELKKNRRKS